MSDVGYKVLLIEDDKIDRAAFKRFVEAENLLYDCTIAGSVAEARSILGGSERFDIIIADYSLGDGTVVDILALVEDTPVIFVTGGDNEKATAEVVKAGACDYLIKDLDRTYLKELPEKVERIVKQNTNE